MNFSDFRVFRTFDTLPFKRLLLHIFQKTNNIEVVFVPEDVDGAREMVETIIFRVCISQGYPTQNCQRGLQTQIKDSVRKRKKGQRERGVRRKKDGCAHERQKERTRKKERKN